MIPFYSLLQSTMTAKIRPTILLYGLQRSGTNFLEAALRKSFRVKLLNQERHRSKPNHKHVRLYQNKNLIPEPKYRNNIQAESLADFEGLLTKKPMYYLVISKDPYSWYLSYVDWSRKAGKEWEPPAHHYIEEYNAFYGVWSSYAKETDRIIFVRYVDLLSDMENELDRLGNVMKLPRRHRFGSRSEIRRVPESESFTDEKKRYYLEKEYMQNLQPNEITSINSLLDNNIMASLGYEICQ